MPFIEEKHKFQNMRPVNIEIDPSGRAKCTGCGKLISKGELRMKEAIADHGPDPTDFEQFDFYHLPHAAKRRPRELKSALANFKDEVPDREELLSVATKRIGEFDAFLNNKWHTNDRGSRVLSGDGWMLTIFTKEVEKNDGLVKEKDWKWSINGDPALIFAALSGEKQKEVSKTSNDNPKSQFGRHFFPTQSDASDDLWLFLRSSRTTTAP